jgi:hypothetical protein
LIFLSSFFLTEKIYIVMARIIIPKTLLPQQKLVKNINKKHKADGAASILKPALTKNKIDLDKDEVSMAAAVTADGAMKNYKALAGKAKKDRDANFEPAFKFLKGASQFIKEQNGGNADDLINWGVMHEGDLLVYPANFMDKYALWTKFWAYHISLAAASPLINFAADNGYVLGDLNTAALLAPGNNDDLNVNAANAETQRKERDKYWKPVKKHISVIANVVKTYNVANPNKAGDWGFVVDNSVQAPKLRTTTLKLGQKRTINKCRIGGKLTNVGGVNIQVFVGKKTEGDFVTLKPGEEKGVEKGMSTLTIMNTSLLESAKFTVLV